MSNLEIKQIIVDYEKQILHYIQQDVEKIKKIFKSSTVDTKKITDPNVRKVAEIIVNYYEQHGSLLVKREFENVIDQLQEEKIITEEKHGEFLSTYEDAEYLRLEEDQFNRILKEWISISCIPDVNTIVKKNHEKYLKKGLGMEFIEATRREFDRLYLAKEDRSLIQVYDLDDRNDDQIEDIEKRRKEILTGIPTHISKLDEVFMGFEGGTLTLVGAITGGGKSTFAMNVSRNIFENMEDPKNVLVISLEMSEKQWFRKYNVMDAFYNGLHLPYTDILRGNKSNITDEMVEELETFLKERAIRHKEAGVNYKVVEARANKYSWEEILSEYKRQLPNFKPDIIFVDYLALFKLGENAEKRNISLGNLSKDIRAYGQDNNIPMVVIVQANRSSVTRVKGKREIDIDFENVEGSNLVSADAENFLALMTNDNDLSEMTVKIVKQREGPKTTVKLRSAFDYCAIYDDEDTKNNAYLRGGNGEVEGLDESITLDSDLEENLDDFIEGMGEESIGHLTQGDDDSEEDTKEPESFDVDKMISASAEAIEKGSSKKVLESLPKNFINARNKGMFEHNYNSSTKNMIEEWLQNKGS